MFDRLIDRLEGEERLSEIAARLKGSVRPVVGDGFVRDLLTGRWLGHPTHPAIVIAPLAGWFGATLLDLVGGPGSRDATQRLVGVGTLAALPAAMSGAADWLTTSGAEERVGTAHAAVADASSVMFAMSWILRRRHHDRAATAAGLAGASLAAATAFLGGHLSFRRGVGVTTVAYQAGPATWTPLELDDEPSDDHPVRGVADGVPFAVVAATDDAAAGRTVHVLEARCSHRGGPLDEGSVADGCIECPWHGARFDLATGQVRRGPASAPQPVYEVRATGDGVAIQREETGALRSNAVSS